MSFWDNLKKAWKWVIELVLLVIGERLLNPAMDLVSTILASGSLPKNVFTLGLIGIIAIVAATVLGVILAEHSYGWLKAANHALQMTKTGQYPNIDPSKRIQVRGKTFENQDVNLDGHTWIECKFRNCNIIIQWGDFDLISNTFDGCRLTAKGGAEGILKAIKVFFPQMPLKDGQRDTPNELSFKVQQLTKPLQDITANLASGPRLIPEAASILEREIEMKGLFLTLKKDSPALAQSMNELKISASKYMDLKPNQPISLERVLSGDIMAQRARLESDENAKQLVEKIRTQIEELFAKYGGSK